MKFLMTLITIILIIVTLLVTYTFAHRLTLPYNSEGNYFDDNSMVVYHQQAVQVLGLFSIIAITVSVVVIYKTKRYYR